MPKTPITCVVGGDKAVIISEPFVDMVGSYCWLGISWRFLPRFIPNFRQLFLFGPIKLLALGRGLLGFEQFPQAFILTLHKIKLKELL